MKLIGHTEITTIDEPDHLEFVAVRKHGVLDLSLPPAIAIAFLIWIGLSQHWYYAVFPLIALFYLFASWMNGPVTRLAVSGHELIARGNLQKSFTNEVRILASEVKSIGYDSGGENEPSGFYVQHGWKNTCLLPGLNREQADGVALLIRRRYPDLEPGDRQPASMLFSGNGGLITLSIPRDDSQSAATTEDQPM